MRAKTYILTIIGVIYLSVFLGHVIKPKEELTPPVTEKPITNVMINDKGYETLQEAIDSSVNNDIIKINIDLKENVKIVNKQITIEGNNHTIQSDLFTIDTYTIRSIINIEDSNILIKNLSINGNNGIDNDLSNIGIYANNSTLTLENVRIRDINHQADKLDLYPYGTALYIVNEDDEHKTDIQNCQFTNFHQTAIYFNNHGETDLNINITGSLINGLGQSNLILQRGIVMIGKFKGDIYNNTISNLKYIGFNGKAYGINQKNINDELNIKDNIFQNVDIDIYVER